MNLPDVVSREEWLVARKALLEKEKEVTRARDMIAAERRKLPMVKVEKNYLFEGPNGTVTLRDMFEGRRQLIVRHFMFEPGATEGCVGCSMQMDSIDGALEHMWARDTTFAVVARAPLSDTEPFKARMGWRVPWYSSFGSEFNYDYDVSTEQGDSPGVSAFIRDGDEIFHTYSIYDRGGDIFKNFYNYLDITFLGRQEDELEHGWEWWRHKDRYGAEDALVAGNNWWNGTRFQA